MQARSGPSWVILLTNIIDLVKSFFLHDYRAEIAHLTETSAYEEVSA